MTADPKNRSTREVLEDHLRLAHSADIAADLERNYAPDCVFLTNRGIYHGRKGARQLAEMLLLELPGAQFVYTLQQVHGRVAFLEWTGSGGGRFVRDGADSFLIENGRIVAQTIHYTVEGGEADAG